MKKTIYSVFMFFFIHNLLFAGAWLQEKNKGYYQIGSQFVFAKKAYDKDGEKFSIPDFTDITTNFYGEFGLTDQLTIIANLPFFRYLKVDNPTGNSSDVTGISDSDIGIKTKLLKLNQSVVSLTLMLGLPTGDKNNETGLWTGSEEWNQMMLINFGHSFYPLDFYFNSSLGFNNRTNGFSDEIRYSVEGGYSLLQKKLLLILRISGVAALKNGSLNNVGGFAGLYANNQNFMAYGPEVHYSITKNFGVIGKFESAAFVKNAPSAIAYSVGIFFKN